ncbi:MAG: peptide chain release factor N(5)-glutamine methyltransferase [bacterium]
MTIIDALTDAQRRLAQSGIDTPRLDAEVLLSHVLGRSRADLYLSRSDSLSKDALSRFDDAVARRSARCPVAYITGTKEFWSIPIRVTPAVLIPRPETETVVEESLRHFVDRSKPIRLLDICTGSGCVAAALASELPNAGIFVSDSSLAAIEMARENLAFAGSRVTLLSGDLFEPVAQMKDGFDLITANPPYIAEEEYQSLQPEIRDNEPKAALIAGKSGLDFILRIIEDAPRFLLPGGWLVMEVGENQAPECKVQAIGQGSYDTVACAADLAGIERVVALRKNMFG